MQFYTIIIYKENFFKDFIFTIQSNLFKYVTEKFLLYFLQLIYYIVLMHSFGYRKSCNIPKMCGPSVTISSLAGLVQANREYREPCLTQTGIISNFHFDINIHKNSTIFQTTSISTIYISDCFHFYNLYFRLLP